MVRIVVFLLLLMMAVPFNKQYVVQAHDRAITPAQMRERMRGIVITQANKHGMPPLLLVETCIKESQLQPEAKGVDTAARRTPRWERTVDDYSYGLCQVKLGTAQWVWSQLMPKKQRRFNIEVRHLNDPVFNAATAAIFLVWLKGRFGDWRMALAAYNAGPYQRLACRMCLPRLKTRGQLALGKGTYSMSIWMRWNVAKLAVQFG